MVALVCAVVGDGNGVTVLSIPVLVAPLDAPLPRAVSGEGGEGSEDMDSEKMPGDTGDLRAPTLRGGPSGGLTGPGLDCPPSPSPAVA